MYFKFLELLLKQRLAYRLDFIFSFSSVLLWSLAAPLFMLLVYNAGATYPGWSVYELLIFLGIYNIMVGLGNTLFFEFFVKVIEKVRSGELELILIKPVDELYLLLSESFEYVGLGDIVTGTALLIIGATQTSLEVNFLLLIIYMLAGVSLLLSAILFISSTAIKNVRVNRLMELIHTTLQFSEYPKNMFPRTMQVSFGIFIPLFLLSYYPASALLGFNVEHGFYAILASYLILIISIFYWKRTLKNYVGAGG